MYRCLTGTKSVEMIRPRPTLHYGLGILHIFCYYLETRILGCLSRHREHIVKELITTVITCLLDMLTRSCDSCQQICHTFCYYRVICDPNLLNALSNAKPGAGSSPVCHRDGTDAHTSTASYCQCVDLD